MTSTRSGLTAPSVDDAVAASALDALADLPLTLNSSLELRAVLRQLITASLAVSAADRCSIFLLRDGKWLEPAVAVGRTPNEDLWGKFRTLSPIAVPVDMRLHADLLDGRAVAVRDVRTHSVIPRELITEFHLRSVVLVPLLAAGDLCGLLAVDYQDDHCSTTPELTALGLIGSYAGMAVRNARLFGAEQRRARLNASLAASAAELGSGNDVSRVYESLIEAFRLMLEADTCGLGVLDDANSCIRFTTLAGTQEVPLHDVPADLQHRLRRRWQKRFDPVVVSGSRWLADLQDLHSTHATHLLSPITIEHRVRGVVCAGFGRPWQLDPDEEVAAQALSGMASAALERASLISQLRRQLAQLDALYKLSDAIGVAHSPSALKRRLNALFNETDARIEGIVLNDRQLARRLGWPTETATSACRRARREVALRTGQRVIGALQVSGLSAEDESDFLEAVAQGVAESLVKVAARATLQETVRDRALAAERERIALDLHDSVGQAFVTTMLLARRAAEELPADSEWSGRFQRVAEVANEGKWALDQSIRALTFVPDTRKGLPAALRAFTYSVQEDSGISIVFKAKGAIRRLPVAQERALYRVAHQAISNAWRHARASLILVLLDYDAERTVLTVRDNGVGLARRPDGTFTKVGFTSMRRAVAQVQGQLSVKNDQPTGLLVQASVPRRLP